jgi:hypothetical protein
VIAARLLIAGALSAAVPGPDYETARIAAIKACEGINPRDSQSGLAMNPDGYRSYYAQAMCFQTTAVEFRDRALCARVRERRTLLFSSWGYSPGNCRTLVDHAVDADRQEIDGMKRQYQAGRMALTDFRIERNGNGRDYDVIPSFSGTEGHGYTIAVAILATGAAPIVVHTDGYFVDTRSQLRIYVRREDIAARFPAFAPGAIYRVRAVMTFSLPARGGSRFLSDAFLERVFPLRERTQTVERDIRF